MGREHRATPANPLAPTVKHEGTDGTKRRGTGAGKTCLEPRASPRLKSPPPRDTPCLATASGTKDSSWAAAEPLECTDVGSFGFVKAGAQQQDNPYFSYDGGTQKLRAYILAPPHCTRRLTPRHHGRPTPRADGATSRLGAGPGAREVATARPSRSCSGLFRGRGGRSPPPAEPNGLRPARHPGCRASGDFVSGREGTKPARLGLSPPGPGADFRFVPGRHSQTRRAAWSVAQAPSRAGGPSHARGGIAFGLCTTFPFGFELSALVPFNVLEFSHALQFCAEPSSLAPCTIMLF